jgi:hypothetical protein
MRLGGFAAPELLLLPPIEQTGPTDSAHVARVNTRFARLAARLHDN